MSFDFVSYLARIDPAPSYTILRLTGGVVNITVRATKATDCDSSLGRFPGYSSFILKYAPPYVAGIGPEAPFSTFRQTIEARALSLFLPSSNSLYRLCEEAGVTVPVLLHHDLEEHVLIISDLGPLPNLSECFGSLLGTRLAQEVPEQSSPQSNQGFSPISPAEGLSIGEKVGSFFASLHQPQNVVMMHDAPYHDPDFLKQDGMLEMILEAAIRPVKEQLSLFPNLFPPSVVSTVYQHIEDDFTRKTEEDERVIALGDCWTGALLVNLRKSPAPSQVGIIDWEFASIGRGVNGDMAQLLAHLSLFEIAATWQGDIHSRAVIDTIVQGITTNYRHRHQALNPSWPAESVSLTPEPHSLTARVMRSAFLAHGAEIINNAFWKEWVCHNELCCGQEHKEKQHCKLIQTMVKRGWWYLYHAKGDQVEYADKQNWDAIKSERILLPLLFGELRNPDLGEDRERLNTQTVI